MTNYNFRTTEFGISDIGIHLLRSGFNYRTITFSEIDRLRIEKGKEIHNWWLVFILGAALIGYGVYLSIGMIKALIEGNISARQARMIFLLLIPVAGGYFVYNSVQAGLVLRMYCSNGDKDMFPLREIIKDNKLEEFKTYLKDKIGTRVQIAA